MGRSRGSADAERDLSGEDFRRTLGEFATGVAVITAQGPGGLPVGMTMSSFNSVSIDPPLVLFSVRQAARNFSAMRDARGFAVNVLARDQQALAERFARTMDDPWDEVGRTLGHAEAPLLAGALAHLECEPYAQYDGGDHVVFVVRVLRHSVRPGEAAPLVFFRSRYRGLDQEDGTEPAPRADRSLLAPS